MNVFANALLALLFAVDGQQLFTFQDSRITESSNLVFAGDFAYTTNDSGDGARIFVIDPATGKTVGITTYGGKAIDVEALTVGPDAMWVGDIGDNDAVRDHVTVYSLPVPAAGNRSAKATAYDLVYEDGPRDAETLLVNPVTGRLYVVSKGLLGGTVYEAPEQLSTSKRNVLTSIGQVGGLVTDGVFFPDGKHALIRDYSKAYVVNDSFATVDDFALPAEAQGEGIGLRGDDVVVSSEGEHAPVLSLALPDEAKAALAGKPTSLPTELPGAEDRPSEDGKPILLRLTPWLLGLGWLALISYVAVGWVRRRG